MRKVRKLSFLGILSVLTVVVFLAGISFMQAQVQAKGKPNKPAKATWAVQLPEGGTTLSMLYGDGKGGYIDGDQNIEVTVEKNTPGAWRKDNDFVTYIGFKISNPTGRYVNFKEVFLEYLDPSQYDFVDPDIGYPCCVFPLYNDCPGCLSNGCAFCTCMQKFMNGADHPYTNSDDSTYRYFLIELHAFDEDILTMETNERYQLGQEGHYHDYIEMFMCYQTGDRYPTYHNIYCSKSAHLGDESEHPFNIWITRKDENTWTIDVGTINDRQFLFLEEYYYETITRGKKTTTERYSTLFQGGDFHFTFDLIRIPLSSN